MRGSFQSWVEWTRGRLPSGGDCPGIASIEWLREVSRGEESPPWCHDVSSYYEDWDSEHDPEVVGQLVHECLAQRDDIAVRFTALTYLYELSHYEYESYSYLREDALFSGIREKFAADFALLVRAESPEELTDWRFIRWEILNSCLIADWDRVRKLYDRAESLQLIDRSDLFLLRAQFNFLVAFGEDESLKDLYWKPKIYNLTDLNLQGLCLLGFGLCARENFPSSDRLDLERLRCACHDLARALDKRSDLPPYRSMLAGCYSALGELHTAAKHYEQLLIETQLPDFADKVRPAIHRSTAISYTRAEEFKKAIDRYERLLVEVPEEKGVYLRIAELYAKQDNIEAASKALRKEFDQDTSADNDWRLSTILKFGEVLTDANAQDDKLKEFFRSNPERTQFAELLLREYWPSFGNLTELTRQEWCIGTTLLHSRWKEPSFSHVYLRKAAGAFATAVEVELKSRIFARFREKFQSTKDAVTLLERRPAKDELKVLYRYLRRDDRITLGQMCDVMFLCRKPQEEILKWFSAMLQEMGISVDKLLKLLPRVVRFRNPAIHPGLSATEDEWLGASKLCRDLLEALIRTSQ